MADNSVFITGIADGAFEGVFEDLPPWATEGTADKMAGFLEKSLRIQKDTLAQMIKAASGTAGVSPEDAKKAGNELEKLFKDLKAEDPRRNKRNKDEKDHQDKQKKWWDADKDSINSKLVIDGLIIKAGAAIRQTFEDNVRTFDNLTAAGINLMSGMDQSQDGFNSLRQLTAQTGVRFTELAASMEKYSASVNSFGVSKFAKTVGIASANLTQFGFSSKESADLLGAYLSVQQGVTDVSKKTADETATDLKNFGNSVFKLSIATGMSRTAIIANAEAISKSTDANLLAGQIGNKAAEGMTTFLASFKDQNIARQILKLMSDPIKPLNETFMNLQKVGMGGFAQTFTQFTKSLEGMPEDVKQQALKSFIDSHRGELEQNKQRLALLKQAGVAEAGAALDLVVGLTQQADAIKPLKAEELKRLQLSNAASKDLANALEKFKSLLQRAFSPTSAMLNILTGILSVLNTVLGSVIDTLDWLGESIGTVAHAILHPIDTLNSALTGLSNTVLSASQMMLHPLDTLFAAFTYMSDKFKSITDAIMHPLDSLSIDLAKFDDVVSGGVDLTAWIGLAAIGYGMYKSMKWLSIGVDFLSKKLFSAGKSGTGKLTEKISSGSNNAGAAGSGLLSGLGKGIGDIGRGIGKGVGGILKGLASGLSALGKPTVLLGVVALAGIAASLWIAGNALKEFADINWETIAKAGVVLVGLGLAGAAAGLLAPEMLLGALAFTALGAAVWVIGEAIQSVGTGLQMFANALNILSTIDGKKLASVSEGLDALSGSGKLALLAFSAAALVAAPGIYALGAALEKLSANALGSVSIISTNLSMLSSTLGSFTGLNTLNSIVDTINRIDIVKALAFGALAKLGVVSLPTLTSTSGVASSTPRSSTLNSPSAVSTNPNVGGEQATAKEPIQPNAAGIEKPAPESSINTALGYQSSLLEQLLLSTNNLVSVNKDILKYSRANQ